MQTFLSMPWPATHRNMRNLDVKFQPGLEFLLQHGDADVSATPRFIGVIYIQLVQKDNKAAYDYASGEFPVHR